MNPRVDFNPDAITIAFAEMPVTHRAAFCAAVAERLLPNYDEFSREEAFGDPRTLSRALHAVWLYVTGTGMTSEEIASLHQSCEAITPEPGDFASDLASAALDAANAVSAALMCCADGNPDHCGEVATYARDTVDMYLQIRGVVDAADPAWEEQIRSHPLMKNEIEYQLADLRLLQRAETIDTKLTQRLRAPGIGNLADLL